MPIKLKRSISLPLITLYGLGNILGAGIYVLLGKVVGEAGSFAPMAFMIASVIAAISAFTYSELASRYPVSAGEAVFIFEGFHKAWLSRIVGILIMLAGIVSSAAIAHGFAGYMQVFFDIPAPLVLGALILTLGTIAAWGIDQSVKFAALLTLVEIGGLLLIIYVSVPLPVESATLSGVPVSPVSGFSWLAVMSGAFLAFYAYIGFEDMVNIAEEVKQPRRTLPRAILLCMLISTALYACVAFLATKILPLDQLASTDAPLADMYRQATGKEPIAITIIGLFAVVNGSLIQIIMASRLAYGMARRNWLPGFLAELYPRTRTPVNSTIMVTILMLVLTAIFPIVTLAEMTSYLVLTVFVMVNLALLNIKQRVPSPADVTVFPIWIPILGFITSAGLLLVKTISDLTN